jgi:predicted nucleotidyltransferase
METKDYIIQRIKETVSVTDPTATIILYGSFARGENKEISDFDLLILIDKKNITRTDEKRVKYPLYEIEFETGQIISPIIISKTDWEYKHKSTPFYENVTKDGIVI